MVNFDAQVNFESHEKLAIDSKKFTNDIKGE